MSKTFKQANASTNKDSYNYNVKEEVVKNLKKDTVKVKIRKEDEYSHR